jgi:hypothetical protein
MPGCDEILKANFHSVRQCALRTGIEVDFAIEDAEPGTNFVDLRVGRHHLVISESASAKVCTSASVL